MAICFQNKAIMMACNNVAYIFMILFCSNLKKLEILTGMHDYQTSH